MIFDIYSLEKGTDYKNLTEDSLVESGLSGGEVRQSILDRTREDALGVNTTDTRSLKERTDSVNDFEKYLYEVVVDDADLQGHWFFNNETIYIVGGE